MTLTHHRRSESVKNAQRLHIKRNKTARECPAMATSKQQSSRANTHKGSSCRLPRSERHVCERDGYKHGVSLTYLGWLQIFVGWDFTLTNQAREPKHDSCKYDQEAGDTLEHSLVQEHR